MAITIERPNIVKVFASDASHGNYLPVKFGTNIPVPKDNYTQIANDNFEYGLESLENDLQMKDLNSVFFYHGNLLGYLFQQGVPEFSAYQNYPMGAVVTYKGNLWIATKDIKASVKEPIKPAYDPCNPCSIIEACAASQVCVEPEYPSKETGWCAFVTKCEYDTKIAELEATDKALQTSIDNLKGVENFSILPNKKSGALELTLELSDGSTVTIPMTKFGHISQDDKTGEITIVNANGSKLLLPKYVAEKSLDQQKGFYFNEKSEKWEVDLADLVKNGSGLVVDKNGNISVKPVDIIDGSTLSIDPATGGIRIDPEWYKHKVTEPIAEAITAYDKALASKGAKVFANTPITGEGTKTNPLGIALGDDFTISNGKIVLANNPPDKMTSISNGTYKFGFHTFTGSSTNTVGLPIRINSDEHEQGMLTQPSNEAEEQYDYNGYYIASASQVDVWLIGNENTAWKITNDYGLNTNGQLVNPNGWGKWQKLDNTSSVTNAMIKSMQDQINSLNEKHTQDIASKVRLVDASGKTVLGYIHAT